MMPEAVSGTPTTASTAQVHHQPSSKAREAKFKKTDDNVVKETTTSEFNCHCIDPAIDVSVSTAEKLADALEVKVNLQSEHCVNGLINGIDEDSRCSHSGARLLSESSSPCECKSSTLLSLCASSKEEESATVEKNELSITIKDQKDEIMYVSYESELQMPDIMRIMNKDLSEPYSIYTYRYFIYNWPKLCFLVSNLVSVVVAYFRNASYIFSLYICLVFILKLYVLLITFFV